MNAKAVAVSVVGGLITLGLWELVVKPRLVKSDQATGTAPASDTSTNSDSWLPSWWPTL